MWEETLFEGCNFPSTVRAYIWVTSEISREQWHQVCSEEPGEGCQEKESGLDAEGGLSLDAVSLYPRQTWRRRDKEAFRYRDDTQMGGAPACMDPGGLFRRESLKGMWSLVPLSAIQKPPSFLFREKMEIVHLTHQPTQLFSKGFMFASFLYNSIWISDKEKDFRGKGSFQGICSKDFTVGQLLKGKFFRKVNIWSWPPCNLENQLFSSWLESVADNSIKTSHALNRRPGTWKTSISLSLTPHHHLQEKQDQTQGDVPGAQLRWLSVTAWVILGKPLRSCPCVPTSEIWISCWVLWCLPSLRHSSISSLFTSSSLCFSRTAAWPFTMCLTGIHDSCGVSCLPLLDLPKEPIMWLTLRKAVWHLLFHTDSCPPQWHVWEQ